MRKSTNKLLSISELRQFWWLHKNSKYNYLEPALTKTL